MKFCVEREQLLQGLQFVAGVVERRQNMPILSNVLLKIEEQALAIIGTDLEIELTCRIVLLGVESPGATTVSCRKLMDICKSLPDNSQLVFHQEGQRASLSAGKSRFALTTLPAEDFPVAVNASDGTTFPLLATDLMQLLESTHFAMAQQDVRYYLNGLFVELTPDTLLAVATDGHRLALRKISCPGIAQSSQFIVPRKGVMELMRLLNKSTETLQLQFSANTIKLMTERFVFVSRLIDGRYPDYNRAIPKNGDKTAFIERDDLRKVLARVAILSNEKYHAVRLHFQSGLLTITAANTEQEEAHDELPIDYDGTEVEIGFNVNYLLDVLSVVPQGKVKMIFASTESSVLIESEQIEHATFIIMPMCL